MSVSVSLRSDTDTTDRRDRLSVSVSLETNTDTTDRPDTRAARLNDEKDRPPA